MVFEGAVNKNQAQVIIFIKKKKKKKKRARVIIISSKLSVQCKDNVVIFYIKWFGKMLYIYIKKMTRLRYST